MYDIYVYLVMFKYLCNQNRIHKKKIELEIKKIYKVTKTDGNISSSQYFAIKFTFEHYLSLHLFHSFFFAQCSFFHCSFLIPIFYYILTYVMLCYAMLCYAVVCCVMP